MIDDLYEKDLFIPEVKFEETRECSNSQDLFAIHVNDILEVTSESDISLSI